MSKPSYEELEGRLAEAERTLAGLRTAKEPTRFGSGDGQRLHELFGAIVESAMDGFWVVDEKGRFLEVNPAYCDLVGYSRDELLRLAITDIEAAESGTETGAHIQRVRELGRDRFLTKHRRKDGTIVDVEVSAHYMAEGPFFFVFLRDVTARQRESELLRASHDGLERTVRKRATEAALLWDTVEQLPLSLVVTDAQGRIEYVNPAFTRLTGYAAQEVIGSNPRVLKSGAQGDAFYQGLWATIGAGRKWQGEVVNRRKDGTTYTQELVIAPVRDRDGGSVHLVGIGQDVTERNRLRESLELTQFSLDHSADAVLWVDAQGRVTYASDGASRMLGYTRDELLAASVWDLSAGISADSWPDRWRQTGHAGFWRGEDEARRKDGSTFPTGVVVTHVRFGGKEIQCAILRDLTERNRTDEALRESARLMAAAERIARFGSYRLDIASGTWTSSAGLDELFGISDRFASKDVAGWLSLVHPEHRQELGSYLAEDVLGKGRVFDKEYRIVRLADGEERWVHGLGTLSADQEGHAVQMFGTIQDITDRKQAETRLREIVDLNRQMLASSVFGTLIYDGASGQCLVANDAAARAVGASVDELGAQNFRLIPSWKSSGLLAAAESVLASGVSLRRAFDVHTTLGKDAVLDCFVAALSNHDSSRLLVIFEDVTAYRRAEDALRKSEARHRALVQAVPDLIFVLDQRGVLLDYYASNPSIVPFAPERFLGRPIGEALPPEIARQFAAAIAETRATKKVISVEYELAVASAKHSFEARLVSAEDDNLSIVIRDVTERKILEAKFLQAQKMEAIGLLSAGLAHDFNNLLAVIISYSSLLSEGMADTDPRREDLEVIRKAGDSAAMLTRQLLAYTRQQVLKPTQADLNTIVEGSVKMLRRVIGEDVELVTALAPDLGEVNVDVGQIEQVIMNLAVNARDAMPDGGKLIIETINANLDATYAAEHPLVSPGAYVLLSVSDTGEGMDEATKRRLFEPFFTTKEKGKGTGLGLATTYGIVKQSRGFIWVYSERGRGTTFKIYLPRTDTRKIAEHDSGPKRQAPRGIETVLLAEDSSPLRAVARRILERSGYVVLEAPDGEAALERAALHDGPIHLLITDVIMPGIGALAFVERLKARRPELKVLFVSGYTDEVIIRQGMLKPGTAFLQKPFNPESLLRMAREVLDSDRS